MKSFKKFQSRCIFATFFSVVLCVFLSGSALAGGGDFFAYTGDKVALDGASLVFYGKSGKAVGQCDTAKFLDGSGGELYFSCEGGGDYEAYDMVELVSKGYSQAFYLSRVDHTTWEVSGLDGSKGGFFSINLGGEEPLW